MNIYHEHTGPSLDHGLEERLKRLDTRLKVTYSSWSLDRQTGWPIHDELTGAPIPEPAHHLWFKDSGGWRHIDTFLMDGGGFTHLNCHYLELNEQLRKAEKPGHIYQLIEQRKAAQQELARRRNRERRMDKAKANAKRVGDLMFHGKSGKRQAKISSYPGQTKHSTPGMILRDAREDGWEE